MEDVWIELKLFIMKNVAGFLLIGVSAIVKASFDIKNKVLTMRERIINFVIAVGFGCVTHMAIQGTAIEYLAGVLVPTVTLFGEAIGTWIYGHIDVIMKAIFERYIKKPKE